jgi:hypothetical protein
MIHRKAQLKFGQFNNKSEFIPWGSSDLFWAKEMVMQNIQIQGADRP